MKNENNNLYRNIQNRIFTIRGVQVMLDRDLAELYGIETRALKQAVKRNIERFPNNFMFKLTKDEITFLVSQIVIPSKKHLGGAIPLAFTEQGVAMLSAVLRSKIAIAVSIQIIQAFVKMKKFIATNASVFQRLDKLEIKQIETNRKVEQILTALDDESIKPKQGIFYNGQIFDAYKFVADLIRRANKSIILIDNYIDDTILTLFTKHKKNVSVTAYTKNISKQLTLDLEKYNAQYPPITIKEFKLAHDRFLIIDNKDIYHFGASLKDLGKKWFAFSKLNVDSFEIINRINNEKTE